MVNPVRSTQATEAHQASQQPAKPAVQAHPPTSKSGEVSRDQVTLKSAGNADHDGDKQ